MSRSAHPRPRRIFVGDAPTRTVQAERRRVKFGQFLVEYGEYLEGKRDYSDLPEVCYA